MSGAAESTSLEDCVRCCRADIVAKLLFHCQMQELDRLLHALSQCRPGMGCSVSVYCEV